MVVSLVGSDSSASGGGGGGSGGGPGLVNAAAAVMVVAAAAVYGLALVMGLTDPSEGRTRPSACAGAQG